MKRSTGPILLTCLTVAAVFAGCSDDPPATTNPIGGSGGSATAGTNPSGGTPMAGSSTTGGTSAGSGGTAAGTGGTPAGGGGAGGTGGTTAGTAGTGGTPEPIVPTIVLIDNVRLQLKPGCTDVSAGGAGGADGGGCEPMGAGGGPEAGAGGMPDVGVGGETSVGGEGGGASAPVDDPPWPAGELGLHGFFHEFTANVMPFDFNNNGFSPGPGMSEGPAIRNETMMVHAAAMGRPGGAVQLSVPFTVRRQQADIAGTFATPTNLTGYELVADVKLVSAAYGAECTSAWMYVWGGTYANDASAEPAQYTTSHLEEGAWKTVRLDLDGPYGFHSSPDHSSAQIQVWGLQLNTWGCP